MNIEPFHKQILHFTHRSQLRRWLMENAATAKECWVTCRRARKEPEGELWYLDVVEEALCFGWIDSTTSIENGMNIQRLSPRRKGSKWTELNKERARRLIRLGLMTKAGRAVLPPLDEELCIDPDILIALQADEQTWKNFQAFPPLYQRVRIYNIQLKRNNRELFESRLHRFLEKTREGIMFGDWNDFGRLG